MSLSSFTVYAVISVPESYIATDMAELPSEYPTGMVANTVSPADT